MLIRKGNRGPDAYGLFPPYSLPAREWGSRVMRFVRRLVKNGNSFHVSLDPRMLAWLQWSPQEELVVEAPLDREVRIRRRQVESIGVPVQPMTLDLSVPGSGR